MFKIIWLLPGFLLTTAHKLSSQQDSTLIKKITLEFCNEFSKKNFSSISGSEIELGLIILPIVTKFSKEIEKEWNLIAENKDDFEKMGEKIGQHAAMGCPKFREFIMNNLNEISALDEDSFRSVTGILQRIEDQQFSCLVIKTKSGKEEKLWWFEFFEGSDVLTKNLNSLMKKNISVKFSEMEVYDRKRKEYRIIKVIKSLK